jgi:serine protease Do
VGLQRVRGARINEVTPNSPAAAAPLLPNDVILEYAGVRVENDSHLINLVNLTEVGRDIPLVVYRDHKPLRMTVKVGPAPGRSLTTK